MKNTFLTLLKKKNNLLIAGLAIFFCMFSVAQAINQYTAGTSFAIGEFVYDDDYVATTSDCVISIYSPTGATIANNVLMSTSSNGWHYYDFAGTTTLGTWPAVMTCGTIGIDLVRTDKTFLIVSSTSGTTITADEVATAVWASTSRSLTDYSTTSIVTAVWNAGTRSLTQFGALAADVWNGTYAATRRLTDAILGSGSLATRTDIDTATSSINTNISNASSSISAQIAALNNISATDVWAAGTRKLTTAGNDDVATAVWASTSRTLTSGSAPSAAEVATAVWASTSRSLSDYSAVWAVASSSLSGAGTIGKHLVDNINATIASRGTSNLTAADVWAEANRTLSDYGTSTITNAIWNNATRTLSYYGNDITAVDVWNVLTSAITTDNTIGKQIQTNLDATISSRGTSNLAISDLNTVTSTIITEILTDRALINNLNNISAADVWAYATRTTTGGSGGASAAEIATAVWASSSRSLTDMNSSTIATAVWNIASSTLSNAGTIGKHLVDNINATIASRGTSNLTAADVWSAATRDLTNYSTSSIADAAAVAVWANAARTLTNYGNDITAEDVWNVLASSLVTSGSIGKQLAENTNTSTIALAVWNSPTRTLSSFGTLVADIWGYSGRTLTAFGALAADVWNNTYASTRRLTDAILGSGSLATRTDIDTATSSINANIAALNNISATDVWAATNRTLSDYSTTSIAQASADEVWNKAKAQLTTAGSIGKTLADNIDATISSRSTSTLTAADIWNVATRTLTDYSTSSMVAAVWANGSRTLTSYGNDITAADVWNVLASSLTTTNSIGKQLAENTNTSTIALAVWNSPARTLTSFGTLVSDIWGYSTRTLTSLGAVAADVWNDTFASTRRLTDKTLTGGGNLATESYIDSATSTIISNIAALNNISAADVWAYATRTTTGGSGGASAAEIATAVWASSSRSLTDMNSSTIATAVWNIASSTLSNAGTIGKHLVDNINATIASRGISNLTAADVWAEATRTLTNYGNNISAADVWAYATRTTTGGGSGASAAEISAAVWASSSRTLTDYATSSITNAIWNNAARTLTSYGNDITAADVWNVLTAALTTENSIGKLLATNNDTTISSRASLNNQTSTWSVVLNGPVSVQTGKTYRAKVIVSNSNSIATDAYAAPRVTLYDANRNTVVSDVAMTNVGTGVYEYTYSVAAAAAQGVWETVVTTQVENGKTVNNNSYWEVAGSPAQVIINSVNFDIKSSPNTSANLTITNEGLAGYEYQYEWCIVRNSNTSCGSGSDVYHGTGAKYINPGEDWNTNLTGAVTSDGTYYFKVIVYFGTEKSGSSRSFAATGFSGGGGGGGGGGGTTTRVTTTTAATCVGADFNHDQKVNSIDFSILLAFWKTNPPFANPCVDINRDKKVNSIDFSIFLSQWGTRGKAY